MFESLNRSQQGDLGEAKAVYELIRLGYLLSKPLHVHLPYDFIAEKNSKLFKVQVKTSGFLAREKTQTYEVQLQTSGGNRLVNTRIPFDATKIDLLFVMTTDNRCWLIPASEITTKTTLVVGTEKYEKYQISGEVLQVRQARKPKSKKIDGRFKAPPFSRDELDNLLHTYPTTKVGKMFNMSDNGIARWAKKWNITKPSRGQWQKIQAKKD